MLFNVEKRHFRALSFARYHQIDAASELISNSASGLGSIEHLVESYVQLRMSSDAETYAERLPEFESLCRQNGSPEALYLVGDAHFSFEDFVCAFGAFSEAAELGSLAALFRMGDIKERYSSHCALGTEFETATFDDIYKLAADGGHVFAKLKQSKKFGPLYYWVYRVAIKPLWVLVIYLNDFRDQRILV